MIINYYSKSIEKIGKDISENNSRPIYDEKIGKISDVHPNLKKYGLHLDSILIISRK